MSRALLSSAGGGLGDALLATPVARALRARYAAVDMLVLPSQRDLVAHVSEIDEVLVDEGSPWEMAARLRQRRYAAAVVTWATLRAAVVPLLAGIPTRVGQARRPYSGLFTKRVVVRSELGDHDTHWTQVLLDYARALGLDTADAGPRLRLGSADVAQAEAAVPAFAAERFLLLHPTRGISHARHRWPVESFAALARELGRRYACRVLLTGSGGDGAVTAAIADRAGVTSLAGRTSIGAFAALAARALAVVALDSGPMHVAAAVDAPTVGIFGLRSDEPRRWAPLGTATAVVRGEYPCPPGHRKETCPDFACLQALPYAAIFAAIDGLLGPHAEI